MTEESGKLKVAKGTDLTRAEIARGNFMLRVNNDVTLEDIMRPVFWATVTATPFMSPGAIINVLRHDLSLDVDLRVVEAKPGYVKVRALRTFVDDRNLEAEVAAAAAPVSGPTLDMPEGYKLVHVPNGVNKGYQVVLKLTGDVLAKGIPTRDGAVAYAEKHKHEAETVLA